MKKAKLTADNDNVYLHIEDLTGCCFELWDVNGKKDSSVKVKIPLKDWKNILKEWKTSKKSKK